MRLRRKLVNDYQPKPQNSTQIHSPVLLAKPPLQLSYCNLPHIYLCTLLPLVTILWPVAGIMGSPGRNYYG